MLDRESTFADPTVVNLLQEKFIPVAIDQWYTRRQNDTEGDFWRTIAGQSPRNDFSKTTQGLFIADASGKLLAFNNNRGPERILKQMQAALAGYQHPPDLQSIARKTTDSKYSVKLPEGGAIIRVSARVKDGYNSTDDKWTKIFQKSISRDNLWITADEISQLRNGRFPGDLALRISRFHLIDNTRGEPTVWTKEEIKKSEWAVNENKIAASVEIQSNDNQRGYHVTLEGEMDFDKSGKLTRLNMIANGQYWGASRFTLEPPPGKFPLDVAFTLADGSDIADDLAPHSSRGWLDGYLRPGQ